MNEVVSEVDGSSRDANRASLSLFTDWLILKVDIEG